MTGLVRKAGLLSAVGLVAVSAALASPPNAGNSTKPDHIMATGYNPQNEPDPTGMVRYVIRDANNVPHPGTEIVLDFTACTDVRLSQNINGIGGVTDCASKRITGTTDGFGVLTLSVVAGGNGLDPPRALRDCVAVTADGMPFPSISVSTADRDGVLGVGSGDFALLIFDFVNHETAGRSDLDDSGLVGSGDLSKLIGLFVGNASALSGSPYCP